MAARKRHKPVSKKPKPKGDKKRAPKKVVKKPASKRVVKKTVPKKRAVPKKQSKRAAASKKAWRERKAAEERRSEAARKAWKTRRKNERAIWKEALERTKRILPILDADLARRARIKDDLEQQEALRRKTAYEGIVQNLIDRKVAEIRAEKAAEKTISGFVEVHLTDEEKIGEKLRKAKDVGLFQEAFEEIQDEYDWMTPQEIYTIHLYHPTVGA